MISEKNILQTDFEGEKNSCKEIPGEKNPTLTKHLSWRIMLEKILHRCISGKKKGQKILTQTKSLLPPPPPLHKSQMVGP